MNDTATSATRWWGEFRIPHGKSGRFRIGPLTLTITRLKHEWHAAREIADQPSTTSSVEIPIDAVTPSPNAIISRYATNRDREELNLWPVLPDRHVVTRPEQALTILPRQELTIYVGSPLWIRLEEEGGDDDKLLADLPAQPPKETWWGLTPREGELCYASRTYGRLRLEEAARYPHRVMTAVAIDNSANAPLVIERLNLPVPRLSVYAAEDGRLWTETITLARSEVDEMAELRLGKTPPAAARRAELVSPARDSDDTNLFFRAFGSLFNGR